jgi:hypothetical protein
MKSLGFRLIGFLLTGKPSQAQVFEGTAFMTESTRDGTCP